MSESKTKSSDVLGDVPDALRRLLRAELDLGRSLFKSVFGSEMPALGGYLVQGLGGCKACGSSGCGSCNIPAPCWMPQPLGERTSHASPCSDACIELVIENCGLEPKRVQVAAQGYKDVTITPGDVVLGPLQRTRVKICASIPKGTEAGTEYDVTVVIAGCKVHYLRWRISVGTFGLDMNDEIVVKDCPDHIHHWYDHFYCPRPCRGASISKVPLVPGAVSGATRP